MAWPKKSVGLAGNCFLHLRRSGPLLADPHQGWRAGGKYSFTGSASAPRSCCPDRRRPDSRRLPGEWLLDPARNPSAAQLHLLPCRTRRPFLHLRRTRPPRPLSTTQSVWPLTIGTNIKSFILRARTLRSCPTRERRRRDRFRSVSVSCSPRTRSSRPRR